MFNKLVYFMTAQSFVSASNRSEATRFAIINISKIGSVSRQNVKFNLDLVFRNTLILCKQTIDARICLHRFNVKRR